MYVQYKRLGNHGVDVEDMKPRGILALWVWCITRGKTVPINLNDITCFRKKTCGFANWGQNLQKTSTFRVKEVKKPLILWVFSFRNIIDLGDFLKGAQV